MFKVERTSIRMNAQIALVCRCIVLPLEKLFCSLPETLQARILTLAARTPNTSYRSRFMVKELQRVQAEGFSVDNIENEEESGVGAPIFDYRKVVGAMSVSGPSNRITRSRC